METISCSWKLSRSFVQVHTPALGLLQGIHYVTIQYVFLHMDRVSFLLKDWYYDQQTVRVTRDKNTE